MEKRDGPKHNSDAQKGQKKPRRSPKEIAQSKENKDVAKNDVIPIDDTQVSGKTESSKRIRRKKDPVDSEHVAPKRQTRKRNNSSARNGVPTDTPAPPKLGDANNSVVEVLTPALEDCPEPKRKKKKTEEGQKTPEKKEKNRGNQGIQGRRKLLYKEDPLGHRGNLRNHGRLLSGKMMGLF